MTRNSMHRAPVLLLAVFVAGGLGWYFHPPSCTGDGRESLLDKREWSILQALEFRRRGAPITGIEFTTDEDYKIICLPGVSGGRVWIMLNPKRPPYYKQLPQEDYTLSEDQLAEILRTQQPISTVEECLSSHARRKR